MCLHLSSSGMSFFLQVSELWEMWQATYRNCSYSDILMFQGSQGLAPWNRKISLFRVWNGPSYRREKAWLSVGGWRWLCACSSDLWQLPKILRWTETKLWAEKPDSRQSWNRKFWVSITKPELKALWLLGPWTSLLTSLSLSFLMCITVELSVPRLTSEDSMETCTGRLCLENCNLQYCGMQVGAFSRWGLVCCALWPKESLNLIKQPGAQWDLHCFLFYNGKSIGT